MSIQLLAAGPGAENTGKTNPGKFLGVITAFWVLLAAMSAGAGTRTILLVPLPVEPSWRDLAYLATVPAATVVNEGAPSALALEAAGTLTPEIQDYLRRYRPEAVYLLGGGPETLEIAGQTCKPVPAVSADAAACGLSRLFWRTCATAVICPEDDYEAALVASALAARLRAPLLFAAADGVSEATAQELRRLQAQDLLCVGKRGNGSPPLKVGAAKVTPLAGAGEVMAWVRSRGLPVSYLAAVNPTDRQRTVIRKLSLAGVLLAAGRNGLVAPLTYETRWKIPFNGVEITGDLPTGLPTSEAKPRSGRIAFDGREYGFCLTGKPKGSDLRVNIDLNGDGTYNGTGEGPFVTGDTVELNGKRYTVTLGAENGVGKADLRLTWPQTERLGEDLRRYYQALGAAPEHLCLVGFPDAIPQAIIGRGGLVDELTSDLPFANADDDPFAEIGIGRVIAENVSFGTLYASRVLTYAALLDPEWQERACQSRWENTYGVLFENVGFDASYRHTVENLKWIVPPAEGKRGKRAQTFEPDSPLARCAVLGHMDHSWWREIGNTFSWDAEVLLAPVVVESGGCLMAALDREADYRSVVARLFRKGAVSFVGSSRPACAQQELQRLEFWNGVLAGQTIGQAHRRGINSALVTVLDHKETRGGAYWYQVRIRTQFGDPAFALRVPSAPKSEPARLTVEGDTVSLHAPKQWVPVKIIVPEDWKNWTNKDLFVIRGPGTYALRGWCGQGYDREETYMTAEFTTHRHVARIEQIQQPPSPLGWKGSYYPDEHADGSRTYRWAVRMADFDQTTGRMINAIDRLDFRVAYEQPPEDARGN